MVAGKWFTPTPPLANDGDGGDYQGHVTTINLQTGAQVVFNAMCSNQNVHFSSSPDCAGQKSGIWAKAGLAFDPVTNRLYAGTGNGTFGSSSICAVAADLQPDHHGLGRQASTTTRAATRCSSRATG